MKRKIIAIMLSAMVALGCTSVPAVYAADLSLYATDAVTFHEGTVNVLDSMKDFASKAQVSYVSELDAPESGEAKSDYVKFVIKEDSMVKVNVFTEDLGDGSWNEADGPIFLFSNESMSNKIHEFRESGNSSNDMMFLDAGTYYMSINVLNAGWGACHYKYNITVGAVPVSKLIKIDKKVSANQNSVTVSVNAGAMGTIKNIQYVDKAVALENVDSTDYWYDKDGYEGYYWGEDKVVILNADESSFKVTKNGTYSVKVIEAEKDKAYSVIFKVNEIDENAPQVTGVKNGKTYKKAVTVKFSDKQSGMKSAKLNGKNIKNGAKVTKKGSYTLKVADKAGNSSTIKFKIK